MSWVIHFCIAVNEYNYLHTTLKVYTQLANKLKCNEVNFINKQTSWLVGATQYQGLVLNRIINNKVFFTPH